MQQPGKKPRACVPCHERKVRCDLTQVGTPCTRCVSKDRVSECIIMSRAQPSDSNKRKRGSDHGLPAKEARKQGQHLQSELSINAAHADRAGDGLPAPPGISGTPPTPSSWPRSNAQPSPYTSHPVASPLPNQSQSSRYPRSEPDGSLADGPGPPAGSKPNYTTSEDDAHLQTLCRMSQNGAVVLSPPSPGTTEKHVRRIFEYYNDFNALTALNDAIGHLNRRRLVQIDLGAPQPDSVTQRELSRLDDIDRAYLAQRRVHELPSGPCCDELMQLFFKHVYPYTPVVDRLQLAQDYAQKRCSTFLLYSIFAITVPYASSGLIQNMSFSSVTDAQREFFLRARLLYDFGCEKGQLNVLQGSIFMSSFQNSFAPDKDFRFWFNNAIHMATLMGLHQRDIKRDLDPTMHRVFRRTWWLLFQRDVMFSLAGFENVRLINDDETTCDSLCEQDWEDTAGKAPVSETLPAVTSVQIDFFHENCKLTQIGARCLRLLKSTELVPSMDQARAAGDAVVQWRHALPPSLRLEGVSHWNDVNVWITVILTFSFRLECIFYRILRRRLSENGITTDVAWVDQRLQSSIFELSTLLRRAMTHDVLLAGPPSMIVCTTQLLAMQIETALNPECKRAKREALKGEIHTILTYLNDIEDRWLNAKWASRVFGWVVKRTGLSLHAAQTWRREGMAEDGPAAATAAWGGDDQTVANGHHQPVPQEHVNQAQMAGWAGLLNPPPMGQFDVLPESWLEDMINQGLLGEQDPDMFEMFGAVL